MPAKSFFTSDGLFRDEIWTRIISANFVCHVCCVSWWKLDLLRVKMDRSADNITGFLRTAYRSFAYCVPSKPPPQYCVPKGRGVTLIFKYCTTCAVGQYSWSYLIYIIWYTWRISTIVLRYDHPNGLWRIHICIFYQKNKQVFFIKMCCILCFYF